MRNGIKIGKTERYIRDKINKDGSILLSLIDPDKQPFEKGAKIAKASEEAGADVILVGGSIGAQGIILDKTTKMIREKVSVPIVLFPGNVGTITPYADATYFMYLMNSREVYWMSTVQIQGAPIIKRMGIEPIPTGYIIIEPGKAVGWISNANPVPRTRGDLAAATALAAQYMGARLIVTDAGSGAEQPASQQLIKAVRSQITVPYIYGGGCRTVEQAKQIIKAGADGIQIGTAFEVDNDIKTLTKKISKMHRAIKEAGAYRKRKEKFTIKPKSFLPRIRFPSFNKFKFLRKPKGRNKDK
jgi:phosphoglycerol geranylgeranyltransferase